MIIIMHLYHCYCCNCYYQMIIKTDNHLVLDLFTKQISFFHKNEVPSLSYVWIIKVVNHKYPPTFCSTCYTKNSVSEVLIDIYFKRNNLSNECFPSSRKTCHHKLLLNIEYMYIKRNIYLYLNRFNINFLYCSVKNFREPHLSIYQTHILWYPAQHPLVTIFLSWSYARGINGELTPWTS